MKKMKYISVFLAVFALMFGISFLCVREDVSAAQKAPKLKTLPVSSYLADEENSFAYFVQIKNVKKDAKVKNVKSSNESVLTVKYNSYSKYIYYYPKKTGKAVISCVVKQNGKTYKLKTTVRVKKADPFQQIKIDGKNIYKAGGEENLYRYYTDAKKVRIAFKLKKGWKLKRIYYNNHTEGKVSKNFKFKNGAKIKLKGDYTSVKIDVKNKKGDIYRYLICIYENVE